MNKNLQQDFRQGGYVSEIIRRLSGLEVSVRNLLSKIGVGREILTANRTYYVATTGSDTANDGLSATSPFLTVQHAVDVVASLDISIYNVVIQCADGTYVGQGTGGIGSIQCKNPAGAGQITIQGNTANLNAVIIDGGFYKNAPGNIYLLRYMQLISNLTPPSGGYALGSFTGARIDFEQINFNTGFTTHCRTQTFGFIKAKSSYTVTGGASYHMWAGQFSVMQFQAGANTVTVVGAPNFTVAAFKADECSVIWMTFTAWTMGAGATGVRYDATMNGVIQTNGGGAAYLLGNLAGTLATGGQYG